jgi:hypothetical protein
MNIFISPISRHIIYNYNHYIIFVSHDISAIFTLLLFFILWNIQKNKFHSLIGKYCIISLILTIISGFLLIHNKLDNNTLSKYDSNLYSITFFTQGINIINISLNAFFINKFIINKYLLFILIFLHIYDLYLGIKSFVFLVYTFNYSNNIKLKETTFELIFILTIPQIINETYYIYIHYLYFLQKYRLFIWLKHHYMSIVFLIYMSLPSILFSIVHDVYWFNIYKYLTNLYFRIIIMLVPSILFIYLNFKLIKI